MSRHNSSWFHKLFDIRGMVHAEFGIEMDTEIPQEQSNMSNIQLSLPVTIKGVKHLTVILDASWESTTGKGFFTDINYRASSTIGASREALILSQLEEQFSLFVLERNQPEGEYVNYSNSYSRDKKCHLVRRIDASEMLSLYIEHGDRDEKHVFLYGDELIRASKYGDDYVDADGERYSILRTRQPIEKQHNFLYSINTRDYGSFGYVAYCDAKPEDKSKIEILHDLMYAASPPLHSGLVLYDKSEREYAKVVEVDGELHLQSEQNHYKSTWKPIILSDRYTIANLPFDQTADGFYFDLENHTIYHAVVERPNYMLVEMADGSAPAQRYRSDSSIHTRIERKRNLQYIQLDYEYFTMVGNGFMQTLEGHIMDDLLKQSDVVECTQHAFWIGLAIDQYYCSLTKATHGFYMELVQYIKYSSDRKRKVRDYLQNLLSGTWEADEKNSLKLVNIS